MKRSLLLLAVFALILGACATMAPGTTGVVTDVNGTSVTVATAGGAPTTYTLSNRTTYFSPEGVQTGQAYLSKGQRVMVWATGTNATRINIEG